MLEPPETGSPQQGYKVTVDKSHLTNARRTANDCLKPVLPREAVLSLFDNYPEDYNSVSQALFPGVPGVPVIPLPHEVIAEPQAPAPATCQSKIYEK